MSKVFSSLVCQSHENNQVQSKTVKTVVVIVIAT